MPISNISFISPETCRHYSGIYQNLLRDAGIVLDFQSYPGCGYHPIVLVEHLETRRSSISKSTFVNYRSALRWGFQDLLARHPGDDTVKQSVLLAHQARAHLSYNTKSNSSLSGGIGLPSRPTKSGSIINTKKRKHIPEKDLERLERYLTGLKCRPRFRKSYMAAWVYLRAGIATGLRPMEWADCEWLDSEKKEILLVRSSKQKVDPEFSPARARSFSTPKRVALLEYRVKDIDNSMYRRVRVVKDDAGLVDEQLTNLKNAVLPNGSASLKSYYDKSRKTLERACKKIFVARKYCLSNGRSQAAADMKARSPLSEVQDQLGHTHGSKSTMKNYGKARSAHRGHTDKSEDRDLGAEECLKIRPRSRG